MLRSIERPTKKNSNLFNKMKEDPSKRSIAYNAVENKARFVLECPLYNPIRDKFMSLFENVVPRSLKYFFQLDMQINIRLYLIEATKLHRFRKLTGLKQS